MKQDKKKIIKENIKTKQQNKQIIESLMPVIKSFVLWLILIGIVSIDYNFIRTFSHALVKFTTFVLWLSAKALFIPAQIMPESMSKMSNLDVYLNAIMINGQNLYIELECTAYQAYLAVIALAVFAGWGLKKKLSGIGIMIGILILFNNIRLLTLGLIGSKYPWLFDPFHDYVWNIVLIFVVWLLWEWLNGRFVSRDTEMKGINAE